MKEPASVPASMSESLQQRQCELESFIVDAKRQLQALARSLRAVRSTTSPEPIDSVVNPTIPEYSADLDLDLDHDSTPVAGATDIGDPLEHLNAIKLRLARQIDNA